MIRSKSNAPLAKNTQSTANTNAKRPKKKTKVTLQG